MRRFFVLAVILLSALNPALYGKSKDKSTFPKLILQARYVYVTNFTGDPEFSTRIVSADRQAIAEVEAGIRKWGRYIPTLRREEADLLIAVRGGRLVGVEPHITIGTNRRDGSATRDDAPRPGVGTAVDVGPPEDTMVVYDARTGGGPSAPLDSNMLWRASQSGGLGPGLPLLKQFRKEVEEAEKKKP